MAVSFDDLYTATPTTQPVGRSPVPITPSKTGMFDDLYTPAPKQTTTAISPNARKYLDVLGESEGADYNTIVGGSSFDDYSKHPGVVGLTTKEGPSTAAGKYQITKTTYDEVAKKLGITDFSPESQDKIALELIRRNGALPDIEAGDYNTATKKLGKTWSSLPSSPYSQPKRSEEWLQSKLNTGAETFVKGKDMFADLLPASESKQETPKKKPGMFDDLFGDKVSDKGLADLITGDKGFSPLSPVNRAPKQHPLATGLSHAAAGVPAAMAGFGTATLLEESLFDIGVVAAPFTGGHSLWAVPLVGSLLAYAGGSYVGNKATHALLPDQANLYLEAGAKQNELSAFAGDLASFGSVSKLGKPETIKKGVLLAAGGAGFEGANQIAEGEFDPTKLAIASLTMPFFSGAPTRLGKIASLEKFRKTKSTENVEDLASGKTQDVYVPGKLGDIKVVDVSKETPEAYSKRHDIPVDEHLDHQGDRFTEHGPVRTHIDATGNTVIEVEPRILKEHLESGVAEDEVGLPKGTFKSPQDYLDFMIHREKIRQETSKEDWEKANPDYNAADVYNSRKAYYDELGELRSNGATKEMTGQNADAEFARIKELEAQGAPKPVIKDKMNLTLDELRSITYGSQHFGEALDRIIAGNFGNKTQQTLARLLQKNNFVSKSGINISEGSHPEGSIRGEYDPRDHNISLFDSPNNGNVLNTFNHEGLHAGTYHAVRDSNNPQFKTRFEKLLEELQASAELHELYNEADNTGWYGLKDIDELISEAFTNPEFQAWLRKRSVFVDHKPQSGWDHFKDVVKSIFNVKQREGISALDQVMDLTHEVLTSETRYAKWDRKSGTDKFDFTEGSYEKYLNDSALEQVEVNPFFNIDSLNIPDAPNDAQGLVNYLFTLDHGKAQDNIIASHIYDAAKFTPEQNERIRLFVEGLNERHVALHDEANNLEKVNESLQKEIAQLYKKWRADNPHLPSSEAPKNIRAAAAGKYKQIEENNVAIQEKRDLAKEQVALSPEDKNLYDTIVKPILESRKRGLEFLMEKGIIPKQDLKGNNFPRKLNLLSKEKKAEIDAKMAEMGIPVEPEPNFYGKFKNYIKELAGGDMGGFKMDMERRRGPIEDRSLFVLETSKGRREVIQVTKSGNIIKWDNKTPSLLTRKVNNDGTMVTPNGQVKVGDNLLGGKVVEGTMQEIEHHSPYDYNKDSLAVLLNANVEIREQARVTEGLDRLMESPMFLRDAVKIERGVPMPEGYRFPSNLDKIPALGGYAFPIHMAEVIEDFARIRDPSLLTNLANILIKNMMLNPLPHIFNEGMHLYNARGLSGWVTPAGIHRFAKYTKDSLDSVLTQDQFFRDTMKYGGSLLSPGVRHSAFQDALFSKGLKEFSTTPDLKELALSVGRAPGELLNAISKQSNRAMWIVRDVMYIQYLKELMATKGLSHAEAIQHVERHMPNYRLPTRVGDKVLGATFGRGLSSVLQNPNISVFSRYHYGMVKSMIETAKDVTAIHKGKAGVEEFKEGIDTTAAIAVALAVLYPLMDMFAQRLTGEKNTKLELTPTGLETTGIAKQRRAGPYHLINAISEVAEGSKDPQAVISAVFTFNPALQALGELGFDRKLYSGQQVYNPQSDPDIIAKDIGQYLVKLDPLTGQIVTANDDPSGSEEGFKTLAAKQLDIQTMSPIKAMKQEKRINTLNKKGQRHSAKSRLGLD
jgi:muramidase (phage lysozyme)